MSIKRAVVLAFLFFQIVMIIYARFVETRYFCWAPFDSQNEYTLNVIVDGQTLTKEEIRSRYGIPAVGLDSRSIQHVKNIISQYERSYGRIDNTEIRMLYTVNGKTQEPWVWNDK